MPDSKKRKAARDTSSSPTSTRAVAARGDAARDVAAREAARKVGEEDRLRRRARFLRELDEAKELRDRVKPRRARSERMRQAMRMRTFRW